MNARSNMLFYIYYEFPFLCDIKFCVWKSLCEYSPVYIAFICLIWNQNPDDWWNIIYNIHWTEVYINAKETIRIWWVVFCVWKNPACFLGVQIKYQETWDTHMIKIQLHVVLMSREPKISKVCVSFISKIPAGCHSDETLNWWPIVPVSMLGK